MKKLFFILLFVFLGGNLVHAQFQTGIANSNQSGVLGITINPANTNQLSNGTDFMLTYVNFSIFNNDFYLPAKPITSLLKPEIFTALKEKEQIGGESMSQKFQRLFDMHRSLKPNGYVFGEGTVYGPSFLTNMGRHSFGLLTALRSSTSTIGLSKEMAIFLQKGVVTTDLDGKTFKLNNVKSSTLAYKDIAFNYSYRIRDSYKSVQRIGINLHYLMGVASMVFEDYGTSWTVNSADSSIQFDNGNFNYNYSAKKSKIMADFLSTKGTGFSFDLGYTYVRKNKARPTRTTFCPNIRVGKIREYQTYKWKLGLAIMDVGMINFNQSTVTNTFKNTAGPVSNLDLAFYQGFFALDRKFQYELGGAWFANYVRDNRYTTYLPTRLNMQFDYFYKDNWYFNLSASQRTPISPTNSGLAPNIVSLAARYETMNYVIGIPVSLIEYQYPVLGLNVRYGPLIIGSNQLLEVIGLRNIKGIDLFFGLKFNISNIRGI